MLRGMVRGKERDECRSRVVRGQGIQCMGIGVALRTVDPLSRGVQTPGSRQESPMVKHVALSQTAWVAS